MFRRGWNGGYEAKCEVEARGTALCISCTPRGVSDGHLPIDANDLRYRCKFNGSQQLACDSEASTPEEYTLAEAVCALGWPLLAQIFRVSLATHVAEPDSWSCLRLEIQEKRACATSKFAQIRGRLALAVYPFQLTRRWTRQEWTTTTKSHRIEHFPLLLVYSVPRSSAAVTAACHWITPP